MSVSSHLHPRGYVCSVDGADGSVGDGVNCAPAEPLNKKGLFRDQGAYNDMVVRKWPKHCDEPSATWSVSKRNPQKCKNRLSLIDRARPVYCNVKNHESSDLPPQHTFCLYFRRRYVHIDRIGS